MKALKMLTALTLASAGMYGQNILFPGTLSFAGTNGSGVSFTYSGTLTNAATISFTETGLVCLQGGSGYCTNGAGVVVIAGSTAVGGTSTFSGTFNGTTNTWTFGSLIMEITGAGAVQVFQPNAQRGQGSSSPPSAIVLGSTTLASLGFPSFTAVNPTITFVAADTNFTDNSGSVSLTQNGIPGTPAPPTLLLSLAGLAMLPLLLLVKRRTA